MFRGIFSFYGFIRMMSCFEESPMEDSSRADVVVIDLQPVGGCAVPPCCRAAQRGRAGGAFASKQDINLVGMDKRRWIEDARAVAMVMELDPSQDPGLQRCIAWPGMVPEPFPARMTAAGWVQGRPARQWGSIQSEGWWE